MCEDSIKLISNQLLWYLCNVLMNAEEIVPLLWACIQHYADSVEH